MTIFLDALFFRTQVGWPAVWRDGGEGSSGWERWGHGGCLSSGSIQAGKLHHPASQDELLQAVAGGSVPAGPGPIQTHLPVANRSWYVGNINDPQTFNKPKVMIWIEFFSLAVKPHSPTNVKAVTRSSKALVVTWEPPLLPAEGLQCQFRYSSLSTVRAQPEWKVSRLRWLNNCWLFGEIRTRLTLNYTKNMYLP